MNIQRSFGKLGNRSMARLQAGFQADLIMHDGQIRGRVENVSRLGCRLKFAQPPRAGVTALIRFADVEVLGVISWTRGERCGVKFDPPLPLAEVERIRLIADHQREQNSAALSAAPEV